jgi:pumilio family protein 6
MAALRAVPDVPVDPAARVFKTLLQGGYYSRAANAVEPASRWSAMTFANTVTTERAESLGPFVLAELCERIRLEGEETDRVDLAAQFGEKRLTRLKESGVKGLAVLMEKVELLKKSVDSDY